MKQFIPFASIFCLAIFAPSEAHAADAAFKVTAGQRQLFLDDVGIEAIDKLVRTMHQPVKKGAVIRIDPGKTGLEHHSIQANCAPIWDPKQKIWKFWTTVPDAAPGVGYWESPDGLHWKKKIVGLIDHKGSKQNHLIEVTCNGRKSRPNAIIYDATDPDPDRRFKAALPNVGFAVSPDGIHWKGLDGIPGVASQDTWTFSFDPQEHLYILKVKHRGKYGRSAYLSTSRDFEHWTAPELVFETDDRDQELGLALIKRHLADPTLQDPEYFMPETAHSQVYNMGMFRYESLYVGLPMLYHESARVPKGWEGFEKMVLPAKIRGYVDNYGDWTGIFTIQLASSRDLKNWTRLGDRKTFIGPSRTGSGAYDTQVVGNGIEPVVRGDELWFYYIGIKSYAFISLRLRDQGAICLAVLRRDGFVSLDGGEQSGTLLTRPFGIPGGDLKVNVDAPRGELIVEVLDEVGEVLARSKPVTGDQLRGQVQWDKGKLEQGRQIQLRFTLADGRLYSYWFE